jgi:hypothetical protein
MSIFTRRELQKRLNSLARVVGKKKLKRIVRDLNIEGNELNSKRYLESLAVAWETVVVSAFADLGDTKYEKKLSNGRRPDVFFRDQGVRLVADVVTVSDEQQHKKNPVEDFSAIINKMWRDSGLQKGSLSWRVEGVDLKQERVLPKIPGCWGPFHLSSRLRPINRRPVKRLALPPVGELGEYVREKVCPFFKELRIFADRPARLDVDEQYNQNISVRFSLSYSPMGSGHYGSYPSYTTITDIESHVIWRRLIDKSEQFSLAKEELPRVLFVCDGGCAALHGSLASGPHEYRFEEMLDHFWRRPLFSEEKQWSWTVEKSISGVVMLPIEPINPMLGFPGRRDFMLKPQLYSNPYSCFPLDEATVELLSKVVSRLPSAVESPDNVLRAIRANQIPSRRLGGFTMSHNSIEMSGVELLRILSGELSLKEFCRNHNFTSNPFENALVRFQTIKSVRVEPASDRDDDKIIIEFGPHDAALGPFIIPESSR